MEVSEECSAFALYGGVPGETAAARFFHLIMAWNEELGLVPDALSVTRPTRHGLDAEDPGPSGPFRRVAPRLLRSGFDRITYIQLITTVPGVVQNPVLNILVGALWASETDAIVVARSSVATLDSKTMLPLASALINALEPEYGIGYRLDAELNPAFYGMGVGVGRPTRDPFTIKPQDSLEEDDEPPNSYWYTCGKPKKVYRQGILRGVYPWNFLNPAQRSWSVGGLSLEQWIRQDEMRGTLTPINSTLTLWRVADSAQEEIQRFLRSHGMILTAE